MSVEKYCFQKLPLALVSILVLHVFYGKSQRDRRTEFWVCFRASAEEMRSAAAADANLPTVNRQNSMQSNLVANAQPISFSGSPVYDSNV